MVDMKFTDFAGGAAPIETAIISQMGSWRVSGMRFVFSLVQPRLSAL